MFLSEDQIVADFYHNMGAVERLTWRAVKKEALIFAHHDAGRRIRNKYNLWHPDNPYTVSDPSHDNFPDQISQRVIEKVWNLCQSSKRSDANSPET